MVKIRVEYMLDKPIDVVFDAITDHANYKRFAGFTDSKLLEPGHDEPNGVGALRLLVAGRMRFQERITRFERPTRMHYRIEELSPLPLRHGRINSEAPHRARGPSASRPDHDHHPSFIAESRIGATFEPPLTSGNVVVLTTEWA